MIFIHFACFKNNNLDFTGFRHLTAAMYIGEYVATLLSYLHDISSSNMFIIMLLSNKSIP